MTHPPTNRRAITSPTHVEALASPVRQELLDTLSSLGGMASVASLAEQVGRHADGLYYHLRILSKAGLVQEDSRDGEKVYRLAGGGAIPPRLAYRKGPRGNASKLPDYVRALLRVAQQDFEDALLTPGVVMDGERRRLWAARNKGWVSPRDVEEINRLLERLCELTSQVRDGQRDELTSFAFVLAPCSRREKRRSP